MLKVVPGEAGLVFKSGGSTTLLVSDLHLGLEKELARKGIRIPPYSMKILDRIRGMGESYRPERLVVLGDVKHSIGKVEDIDWNVLPWFFETLLDLFSSVEVVPGNHDGGIKTLLPSKVKLHPATGMVLGDGDAIGVTHGHSWPSREVIMTRNVVIGHSHFRYEMRDKYGMRNRELVWLFARYSLSDLLRKAGYKERARGTGELAVMPPFNRLVGGQAINVPGGLGFGPVLSSGAVDVKTADMFLLDGTRVG